MSSSQMLRFSKFGKKIVGFGMTYRDKKSDYVPASEPVVFLKPTTSYLQEGQPIKLPPGSSSIEHEVELGIVIGKEGSRIDESRVIGEYIAGYVLALDMTDRQRQNAAKKAGLPYTLCKGFDTSCPVGDFIDKSLIPDPQNVNLWLTVNGTLRQKANTAEMIYTIPYLISWVSNYITLEPGDLILTGTPPGCGPVTAGDSIECGIGGITSMRFNVDSSQ